MFDPFDVPGYDVPGYDALALLESTGRTVKALTGADRSRVVLRRVLGGEHTRQRLRREAALWGSVASAHVVAVRDVVTVEPDVTVVVSDYASGGGLDTLLARRGSLDDGEIVTLVVPLAETLAAAHARGLVHGRVSTGNVVFAEDGRPMLADAALSCSDDHALQHDVDALVDVATSALCGRCVGPVYAALTTPSPSAAALAASLRAAAPARAIALHKSTGVSAEPLPTARAEPRRRLAVVIAASVAMALVVGVVLGHRASANATRLPAPVAPTSSISVAPTAVETPTTVNHAQDTTQPWQEIVRRLEQQRVHSYTDALAREGLRPIGLHMRLESVRLLSVTSDRAVVRVVDGWSSYTLMTVDGRVAERRPARTQRVLLVLHRSESGWGVQRVVG